MFFHALATDYDGTLAADGIVSDFAIAALEALRRTGRKLILVTGREVGDLGTVFGRLDLFDRVVAENGALLLRPETGEEVPLAPPPPRSFVARLKERRVTPFSEGRVIVATRVPHDVDVLAIIRDLGLELQIIFNKGAVMVLPPGVNKASGLAAAAAELGLSRLNIVAVGDAENDHAFISACGCGVAVANALDMLKDAADWVTEGARGDGVAELAYRIAEDDLAGLDLTKRVKLRLGRARTGAELRLNWRGERLVVAGAAAARRAALLPLLEAMGGGGLQFVVFDRAGVYARLHGATAMGARKEMPEVATVLDLLEDDAAEGLVLDLSAAATDQAAAFAAALLPRLERLRRDKGRPHWLVLDGADDCLAPDPIPVTGWVWAADACDRIPRAVLEPADVALVLGDSACGLGAFAAAKRLPPPAGALQLAAGEGLFWRPAAAAAPVAVSVAPPLTAEGAGRRA